ncbi:class I SAM-dependent methyltransferase [Lichenihabitans psoromatis]|uniref:class I SAM-dependent methyltransferase n=1 Tax=Lichenihabitans psoromatis TaxID=2528642 RepID=UPI001035AE54|nr:class I SAM-dependent methyltransferase [Lichenihabitans psoromatis]
MTDVAQAGLIALLNDAAEAGAPPTIALMRLLIEAPTEIAARQAIDRARMVDPRIALVATLWRDHPEAWAKVRGTVDDIAHQHQAETPDAVLTYWATTFDHLVEASPEASVALYSLGSPALLAVATDEIVTLMGDWGLLGRTRDALDLGCGIGRFLVALAPHLGHITGLDLSAKMVAEAKRRCAALPNVTITRSSGRDLDLVPDQSLDLVLAADVFPYLVQASDRFATAHIEGIARTLRPGGAALILNYSYRGDLEADRRDVAALAGRNGLEVRRDGTRDLTSWDAAAFLLRRP